MPHALKQGDSGPEVTQAQQLLAGCGYPVAVDGVFGAGTARAVRAFQAQHVGQDGTPLVVDGQIGPLTWWSLMHPQPGEPEKADFATLPSGGSRLGRAALAVAIAERRDGAREVGGNNRGPWVRKYLAPAGLEEGNSWCASFVSWCYQQGCRTEQCGMPFAYNASARGLLRTFQDKGWAYKPGSGYAPQPGDLVVWWRVQLAGWQGHVGLVYECRDGMLYTIEGNKSPRVEGFSYVASRMDKLLGFGHVPD